MNRKRPRGEERKIVEPDLRNPTTTSEWLLLALILSLPFMNPAIAGPVVATDVIFLALIAATVADVLLHRRRFEWRPAFTILLLYALSLAPSLLATADPQRSAVKYATEFYLIGLAILTASTVRSEAMFRRAIVAWLIASLVVSAVAVPSVLAYATHRGEWLLDYSRSEFGTLPPGPYVRLTLTFLNANMACNYLTVSIGLLFAARAADFIRPATFRCLAAAFLFAALTTISPGLGGIALLAGFWCWLSWRNRSPARARLLLLAGIAIAALFVVALAVTPILHPTAPFLIHLPGGLILAPSGRLMVWSAALREFAAHPIIGHGIGVDPAHVRYLDPVGHLETLTDAHNVVLSIGAQCGIVGLIGLAGVIFLAIRRVLGGRSDPVVLLLGATFLDAFVYQGIGGSFEDSRHLWVLLGLLIAAPRRAKSDVSREDENNRRAGAPSHC